MPEKITKKQKITCLDHSFSIKAKSRSCYYQCPLNLDMCRSDGLLKKKKKQSNCYQGPIFNKDKNCHTPTFILASQKKKFQQIELSMNIENNQKFYAMRHEKSLMPKPNSKSMFCSVCKQRYQDYLEHINKSKHKMNIHNNLFTKYLIQEAEKFKQKKQISTPSLTTESTNLIVISSDEQQDIQKLGLGKPRKKVKRCAGYQQVKKQENKKVKQIIQNKQQVPYEYNNIQPLQMGNGFKPYNLNFSYNFNFLGISNMNPVQNMYQPIPQMNFIPNFTYFTPQIVNQQIFNRTFFNIPNDK